MQKLMLDNCLRVFGSNWIYVEKDGTEHSINGVFDHEYLEIGVENTNSVNSMVLVLFVQQSKIGKMPVKGTTVRDANTGKLYSVYEVQHDSEDMASLIMHEKRSPNV